MFCLYRGLTLELGYIQCLRAGLTALQRGHGQSQVYKACQTVNRGREGEGASTLGVQSTATAHLAVNWLVDFTRWISWPQLGLGSRCSTVFTITKGSIRASPSLDATRPLTRALWEP